MGRDKQAAHRQRGNLERSEGKRVPYERVLIVCEGSKTEPGYFGELKIHHRLQTAAVKVLPSDYGTDPLSVVRYARDLFIDGSHQKRVGRKAFERVCAVFDRDDHRTYYEALDLAASLDRKYKNDLGNLTRFNAVVSIPCFEIWFLLHYISVGYEYELHRDIVLGRLREYYPGYEKGAQDNFVALLDQQGRALANAKELKKHNTARAGNLPYTDAGDLVEILNSLACCKNKLIR